QRLRHRLHVGVLSICPSETSKWSSLKLPAYYVPAFVNLNPNIPPNDAESSVRPIQAPYALYHARLDIAENMRAVRFLLSKAAIPKQVPLVIAGSRIPDSLRKTIGLQKDCHLVDTPSPSEMWRWIQHAAINCIPCYGMAGLRLKIIHAMMGNGHVLVSRDGVKGMPWAAWLTVVESEHDWEDQVRKALEEPLQADDVAARHAWVLQHFDQRADALKMLDLMGIIPS
ncbi:MAG: glycosyltransferase, partial [Bacteroidota bacterium]